jgi:Leucine-rich repeat (LRR) protein
MKGTVWPGFKEVHMRYTLIWLVFALPSSAAPLPDSVPREPTDAELEDAKQMYAKHNGIISPGCDYVAGRRIHWFLLSENSLLRTLPDLPFEYGVELGFDPPEGFLRSLGRFRNLHNIRLVGGSTDAKLAELVSLPKLERLDLFFCHQVTDVGLRIVARLKNLRSIRIVKCGVTEVGVKYLTRLEKLNCVYLDCDISDAVLKDVTHLKELQELGVASLSVSDAGLKELRKLICLKQIRLDRCKRITDDGVREVLTRLTNLESLSLSNTKITDALVPGLTDMKQLRQLSLYGCKGVTDASVKHLMGLRKLDSLDVRETGISQEGALELKKVFPWCETTPPPTPVGQSPSSN